VFKIYFVGVIWASRRDEFSLGGVSRAMLSEETVCLPGKPRFYNLSPDCTAQEGKEIKPWAYRNKIVLISKYVVKLVEFTSSLDGAWRSLAEPGGAWRGSPPSEAPRTFLPCVVTV